MRGLNKLALVKRLCLFEHSENKSAARGDYRINKIAAYIMNLETLLFDRRNNSKQIIEIETWSWTTIKLNRLSR